MIDFIGIGVQKAGTTWIHKCLEEHPDVCVPERKELNFFSDNKRWRKGLSWYRSHFIHCDRTRICGEYSPNYYTNLASAERIRHLFPKAKLIVVLRHPVDRAFSHYLHSKAKGNFAGMSFADVIKTDPAFLEKGKYAHYLTPFFELFSLDQILLLLYEDLERDPKDFIQRIYTFIGVKSDFTPSLVSHRFHTARSRSSILSRTLNKTYLKLRKYSFGRYIIDTLRKIGLKSHHIQRITEKTNATETLARHDRDRLTTHFQEDIERLEKLTGLDLSHWKHH